MSLYINTNNVISVLLADGWHEVVDSSFDLDAYEMYWDSNGKDLLVLGGGQDKLTSTTGFSFKGLDGKVFGPLTSVLVVKTS